MRRILGVMLLVIMLLTVTTSMAAANWGFDIVATGDTEDGVWDGSDVPPDATNWNIYYWTDSAYILYTNSITFYVDEIGAPAVITQTLPAFGMPPMDIMWVNHYIPGPSGDQGAYSTIVYLNAGSNFTHAFSGMGLQNGDILMSLTASTGTSLNWGSNNSFIVAENNPGTLVLIKNWINGPATGNEMFTADMMLTDGLNGGGSPPPGSPAAPVAEIITIVLVSMGLIALGGYVWYRRHRKVAAVAA